MVRACVGVYVGVCVCANKSMHVHVWWYMVCGMDDNTTPIHPPIHTTPNPAPNTHPPPPGCRERNYHCFYYLFEAAKEDKDLTTSLELNKQFNYMTPKEHVADKPKGHIRCRSVSRRKSTALAASIRPEQERKPLQDDRKYRQLRNAFRKIGVTAREERGSYEVLAGVLHLGEVAFDAVASSAGTGAWVGV